MARLRIAALGLAVLVLAAVRLSAQEARRSGGRQGVPPGLRRDVAGGNRDWGAGLKAGDARLIARSYAPDGVFCGATGDCIRGSDAITAHYEDVVHRLGRAVDASVESAALRVDGDLAYESGRARAVFPGGRVLQGRYSTVWKRQPDGHWKIFRNMAL